MYCKTLWSLNNRAPNIIYVEEKKPSDLCNRGSKISDRDLWETFLGCVWRIRQWFQQVGEDLFPKFSCTNYMWFRPKSMSHNYFRNWEYQTFAKTEPELCWLKTTSTWLWHKIKPDKISDNTTMKFQEFKVILISYLCSYLRVALLKIIKLCTNHLMNVEQKKLYAHRWKITSINFTNCLLMWEPNRQFVIDLKNW